MAQLFTNHCTVAASRGTGFYGSNKRIKLEVETSTFTRYSKFEEGTRVVMFHRVNRVREKGAMVEEAKPSEQARNSASDTDAYILSMYKNVKK